MKPVQIGDFLKRNKDVIEVEDSTLYQRVTIKTKNQGVSLRDEVYGSNIGTKSQFRIKGNQFILSKIDARLGAFGIVPESLHGAIATPDFPVFDFDLDAVNPNWFNLFTSTSTFIEICKAASRGVTNRQRLSEEFFLSYQILMPSKPEQDKIVARLQALQALHREADTTLARLKADVKRLRQSILQDAIQGKLVDYMPAPGEKTGAELLADIRAEKERSARAAGKKPEAALPPVTRDEMPFDVPEGWVWCRLGEIALKVEYGTSQKSQSILSGGVPVLRMNNVQNGKIQFADLKYVDSKIDDLPKLYLEKDDILFNRTNSFELVGKAGVFPGSPEKMTFASYLIRLSLLADFAFPNYVNFYLNSNWCRKNQIEPNTIQQNGQANFNGSKLQSILVPLPSVSEQNAILKIIEEHLAQCDQLDQKLATLKTKTEHLWKSELQQIFKFESA